MCVSLDLKHFCVLDAKLLVSLWSSLSNASLLSICLLRNDKSRALDLSSNQAVCLLLP